MTATYLAALKTDRMQLVADYISGLTPTPSTGTRTAGTLVIGDSTLSGSTGVLATITLNATAATVSGPTLTLAGVPLSGTATAAGTPALAEIRNSAGTPIRSAMTVGTSGADVIVSASPFILNGPVTVTAGTITHG